MSKQFPSKYMDKNYDFHIAYCPKENKFKWIIVGKLLTEFAKQDAKRNKLKYLGTL